MRLILDRPWFRRIWILQEVANARRSTTVHCGNKSISATIFSRFPALIALTPAIHCQSVLDIMPGISRNESWLAQGQKLQTLIVKFRESEATDDRDKIYALLGMSSDAHRSNILNSNYDKSSQQVIREAVSFILSENHSQLIHDASLYQFVDWSLTRFLDNIEDLEGAILMDAFEGADEEFLKLLIETDVCRISSRNFFDRTPVHWAVQREQPAILKMLLDTPLCSFEKVDSVRQTPLSLAIQVGNAEIIQLLLHKGAALEEGHFKLAVEKENINIVDLLVQKGTNLRAKTVAAGRCLFGESLVLAINIGNYDIIKLLLNHGARVSLWDLGATVLNSGNKVVKILINHGVEIGATASQSQVALLLAAHFRKVNIIRLLIKRGVELEVRDWWGRTPLMIAVRIGEYESMKLLLDNGAKLHIRDEDGKTALYLAIEYEKKEAVKFLLKKYTKLRDREIHYQEAFTAAIKFRNKEVVELLLKKGVDFERKDERGDTGLLGATRHNDYAIVELLLLKGADIEAKNRLGRTALSTAVMEENIGITQLLIGKGAELETRDQEGKTPLQNLKASNWGSETSRRELVALLLEWGAIDMDDE
ncbi:hypothetical protein BofuT4_P069900.1 [Botrytis cinerea T4]|uniref:Uncharacterized protein n=1 Tax=Botryotinia fuckeliana (strain T4) TaxID=999810 RepID=G2XQP5_BOTF4|nr:hypothetical protein BofuT4_P069900.1 [Botrytis cinerea T4]